MCSNVGSMWTTVAVVEYICTVWYAYLFRGICHNVKFIYTRVPVHTVDCSGFIRGMYDIDMSYVAMN